MRRKQKNHFKGIQNKKIPLERKFQNNFNLGECLAWKKETHANVYSRRKIQSKMHFREGGAKGSPVSSTPAGREGNLPQKGSVVAGDDGLHLVRLWDRTAETNGLKEPQRCVLAVRICRKDKSSLSPCQYQRTGVDCGLEACQLEAEA